MKNRNKKSRGRTVLNQHLKDIKTNKTYSSESSPYWEHLDYHTHMVGKSGGKGQNEFREDLRANPDGLPEIDEDYHQRQIEQQEIIEAVKLRLTRRERQIFDLLAIGSSQTKIALALGIRQPAVSVTIRRIRKKFMAEGYKTSDNEN